MREGQREKTGKRNEKKKLSLCGRHPCIVPGPAHSCLRPYPLRAKRLAKQRLSRKASNSFCATHTHTHCGTHISSSLWKLLKERKAKDRAEGEGAEKEREREGIASTGSHLASAADKQDKVTRHKVCQRSQRKQIHQPSMRVAGRPKLERMPEQPPRPLSKISSPHPKPSRARLNNKPLSIRLLFRRSPTQAAPAAIEISWQEFSITMPTYYRTPTQRAAWEWKRGEGSESD